MRNPVGAADGSDSPELHSGRDFCPGVTLKPQLLSQQTEAVADPESSHHLTAVLKPTWLLSIPFSKLHQKQMFPHTPHEEVKE